jgi:hypothetical protein
MASKPFQRHSSGHCLPLFSMANQNKRMEYVDVLDSSGRPVGKMKPKSEVHRDGDWHGAAHLWILNREGQILIQRRSPTKENWPRSVRWRTLHDSHLSCPSIPITLQPALALADTPVFAILPTGATSVFTSWHNRLSGKIRHDFFFPAIPVRSSPQPSCSTHSPPHTISKTHSKHIVPSGGFAQPTLSLVLRRENLRNPSQHFSLSTSDRVPVGLIG